MQTILAARSNFSLGESILTVERLVDQAKEVGATTVALTDTMTVTGLVDFSKRAKKAGIKPIIGCRLRLVDDPKWRKPKKNEIGDKNQAEFYLTWYVLSEKGLQALYRLLTLAHSSERFYFTAKLGFDDLYEVLKDVTSDDVVIASSDVYSVLHHASAREILQTCSDALSRSNVFLTLSPIESPLFDTLNAKAINLGKELDLPFLVTRPVFYGRDEDEDVAHELLGAISSNTTIDKGWHKALAVRDFYPNEKTEFSDEIKLAVTRLVDRGMNLGVVGLAFANGAKLTDELAKRVTYEWAKQPPSLPIMAPDEFAAVVEACKKGWSERFKGPIFGHKPTSTELKTVYQPRLAYELSVLKKLNFSGYFLLVQDVVGFAKSSGILVGPGRGSVGGSLVAYLMGITDCDPIRFNLLFERFINPDRIDLPDADLDFMSERRHEIVEYLIKKYGADHVAGVANYMQLGTASSIRDVSRVCNLPESAYRCSKFAPKAHGAIIKLEPSAEQVPEIAAFRDAEPFIWQNCLKLEGVMRGLGQHAAGIVVSGCKLTERSFIDRRKEGEGVVNWDKRIVEDQGLIKMDILGLSTLDLIALTLKYIEERHSTRVNLARIPLDDPQVLDLFAKGKTTGVFQFESGGMRRLLKELGRDGDISFEDITAATALYRPGPMESGMMDSYWKRKQGSELVDYDHPLMQPILEPTFGVICYQEQVMQVARAICGYSAPDADKLRKIMGKKLPDEMAKERDKFVQGAVKGWIKVELDDGRIVTVHRDAKFAIKENSNKYTIEDIISNCYTLNEVI
jgi:DNA polymerase III subunit alpha